MRRVAVAAVGLILLAAHSVSNAQRSSEAAKCYDTSGHADARECLERMAVRAEATMRTAEASFRNALKVADEDASDKERALASFNAASVAYLRYRSIQCDQNATLAFGGNAAGDRRLLCQIDLDTRRTADINRQIEDLRRDR